MSSVKKTCICALCTALCCVLPMAFHALALGPAFSPMHLPILLCGLVCGWPYGAFCGVAGSVLSSCFSGMPAAAQLIYMVPELCAYGLFTGLLMNCIRTGRTLPDLYLSLTAAMVLGRVAGGAARALFYLSHAESYSIALWAGAYFVQTAPGAVLQIAAIPPLVLLLTRAGLIPAHYGKPAFQEPGG